MYRRTLEQPLWNTAKPFLRPRPTAVVKLTELPDITQYKDGEGEGRVNVNILKHFPLLGPLKSEAFGGDTKT